MPSGMRVKRHGMPTGTKGSSTVPAVGRKSPEDRQMEERIRAHIRRRMEELRVGVTEAAAMVGCDQGNLSKILTGSRGIGVGLAARIFTGLKIDPLAMFLRDPELRFFEPYVPRAQD